MGLYGYGCGRVLPDDDPSAPSAEGGGGQGGGGGPDAGRGPDAASGVQDAGVMPCNGSCTQGTQCELGRCRVETAPSCASPIQVKSTGGHFVGTLCPDASRADVCGNDSWISAHVFTIAAPPGSSFAVTLGPGRSAEIKANALASNCVALSGQGCASIGSGGGTGSGTDAVSGLYAVGALIDGGCTDYDVTFTPK